MARSHEAVQPIYPVDPWAIREMAFNPDHNFRSESVFALGNGYIGMRGTFEEGLSGIAGLEGTYLNGFYESEIIRYPEIAYGFAETSQTMLNVTNGKVVRIELDGEPFSLTSGTLVSYHRSLNLREGSLTREVVWRSPTGREARIELRRLVCLQRKHIAAVEVTVTPLNFSGTLRLVSLLDGDVSNISAGKDPRIGGGVQGHVLQMAARVIDGGAAHMVQKTPHTGFSLLCAMQNTLEASGTIRLASEIDESCVIADYNVEASQGQPVRLTKYLAYVTTRDMAEDALLPTAQNELAEAAALGFAGLVAEQVAFLEEFWQAADIEVTGDALLQQGLRFNTFHLLQSVGRDGRTNIAAKGLTGEGYEGHYFWDTEMYVIPFFLYHHPEIARNLLEYRYSILDNARNRAREMGHARGALFPWRTIAGDECSAYFPAGTAQYHINADVAFALVRYLEATADQDFLREKGAEILFETARLWADLGDYIPSKGGKFCINGVTGPDEYSAIVNNNAYTNLMARENLNGAVAAHQWMTANAPQAYTALAAKIGLSSDEVTEWERAAAAMYVPYDAESGLYLQDDSFLSRAPWDFASTPPENYPLLIHYHPLVIYRYQVCKQADLVLALYLLSHQFTQEEKKRSYEFYEKVTTHDSSLSTCIFSIVASEIGEYEKAYGYFLRTARMDLDDYHGNVKDGVHIANMAGTWLCMVNGFGGMRAYGGSIGFRPYLPAGWEGYAFNVKYQGRTVRVSVSRDEVTYTLLHGQPLTIAHYGEPVDLAENQPVTRPPVVA